MAGSQMADGLKKSSWTSWTSHCCPSGKPLLHHYRPKTLHIHTAQAFTLSISYSLALQFTKCEPQLDAYSKPLESLSLHQSHDISLLLTDRKDTVGHRHEGHCHRLNEA